MHNKRIVRTLFVLFFIVILFELIGEALVELADNPLLVFITKPLMMPVLAVYFIRSIGWDRISSLHKFILAALFFSWLGDLFLMVTWTGENLFLFGLSAFLIAHLMYISGFRNSKNNFLKKSPMAAVPLILYMIGLIYALYKYDNGTFAEMQFPVILYAGVIMVMVLAALNRRNNVAEISFQFVFWGALLFMFSDSLIAINKFTPSFEDMPILIRILIMSTYAIGQFFIVEGVIRQRIE